MSHSNLYAMLATFYYPSKDGQSLYATANEWFARKQFKRKRQQPIVLGNLPQHVVAKFKPKKWA